MVLNVFIQPRAGSGPYGPIYGEGQNYPCYIEENIKNIKNKDGKDAVSSLQIFLDGSAIVNYGDKITFGSANPPILLIARDYDKGQLYSVTVYT